MLKNKDRLLLLIIFLLFLAPRLAGLGKDLTNSDAARWHTRSENFLVALKIGDFKSTYQRYHPGVVLMWINAAVKQFAFSYQLTFTDAPKTLNNADWYPTIHGISKGANVLMLFGLFVLQLHLLRNLTNKKVALWYGFFLAIEPYFIGINRWFHLSSFEVYFAFTSLLALLMWSKSKSRKFLILSAVLFALALLSKITSLIMGGVFLYVFVAEYVKTKDARSLLTSAATFAGVCFITLFLLFPALWVAPGFVFSKIYNAVFGAVSTDVRSALIPDYLKPIYFAVIALFKLSPVTVLLFLMGLWKLRKSADSVVRTFIVALAVYYLVFIPATQKIDRYVVMFYPSIFILLGVFVSELSSKLQKAIIATSLLCFTWATVTFYPLYSAYYSPIFGGSQAAMSLGIYENSGEYFAQAADYLNVKGRDIKVYVPDNVDSFRYYFNGNLVGSYEDLPDYVVRSLDIDRDSAIDPICPTTEYMFGNKQLSSVYVQRCD
jgi:hypothetical protein